MEEVEDETSNLMGLDADGCQSGSEDFFGLWADAEIGVGLGKYDSPVAGQDVGGGKDQAPGLIAVYEGDVDQDGAVVVAVILGDGVGEAELLCDCASGIGEDGEGQTVLANHEVTLASGLGANGGEQRACLAEAGVEVAPRLELSNAVGAPAAAKEVEDERPKTK